MKASVTFVGVVTVKQASRHRDRSRELAPAEEVWPSHNFLSERYLHPALEIIACKQDIPPNANAFPAVLSSPLHNASPSDPRDNKGKISAGSGTFRAHIRISVLLRSLNLKFDCQA